MSKIVLSTFGSLGDLHPKIALGLELRRRGHDVVFNVMEFYREKIESLGFELSPLRPTVSPEDREFGKLLMDAKKGTETILRELIMPNLQAMYEDVMKAVEDADLLITGEIIYVAKSVVEKTGIKWISTSLAPISFFSAHDPNVYPTAQWYEHLRFLPVGFHQGIFKLMSWTIRDWLEPYREFRRSLGLDENHDPVFFGKNSNLLHLALFSKVLSKPQPDWHSPTLQTGFCFYDGKDDLGKMPEGLTEFLENGEPPIVFTLGSAAVMDAGNFFEESAKAARILNRRAVLLYGVYNEPPKGLDENIVGFDYAPYSQVFPKAAAVVHQGGVGTTAQVLRAGVPHLIMPYSHDQPDNAARCERVGVAETISRDDYTAENAAKKLQRILADLSYKSNALEAKRIVEAERGTETACDAIEAILQKPKARAAS
ncbi:MAG TPA: nucleotide disphospho-sugar-binding domain-containing protein [Pyrinomonadaceae bacterium]|nr:nucleotide disphospho-sugar-binding domain-containing protein [Pyrinomonadaceae bacterium]